MKGRWQGESVAECIRAVLRNWPDMRGIEQASRAPQGQIADPKTANGTPVAVLRHYAASKHCISLDGDDEPRRALRDQRRTVRIVVGRRVHNRRKLSCMSELENPASVFKRDRANRSARSSHRAVCGINKPQPSLDRLAHDVAWHR